MRLTRLLALLVALVLVAGSCTTEAAVGYERLTDIDGIDQMSSEFNAQEGSPRLILLLSPTRPICRVGASWVQKNILEPNPDADIEVTAVWFNMLPLDARERWDPSLMTDPRVVHYWDSDAEIGRWFGQNQDDIGFSYFSDAVVWDAYFLFGPNAEWTGVPTPLESFGFTVLADKEELFEAIGDLWETS